MPSMLKISDLESFDQSRSLSANQGLRREAYGKKANRLSLQTKTHLAWLHNSLFFLRKARELNTEHHYLPSTLQNRFLNDKPEKSP